MHGNPAVIEPGVFERRTGIQSEDLRLLRRLPMFDRLPAEVLRTLLAESVVRHFPKNTLLFLHEEPANRFFIVFDGWVKLFRETANGHESVIAVFTKGESFAEAAIFESGTYPVSAAMVDDGRLLVVPAAPFLRCMQGDSAVSLNVMASMSRHLRRLVRQIEQLTARSTTERLADFLLKLTQADVGSTVVHLPLDKSLIAARLGMQPETFSRSLARLRKFGVECDGPDIIVPDITLLRDVGKSDVAHL